MDAVGVGAALGSGYSDVRRPHVLAAVEYQVHLLCILQAQVGYSQVVAVVEGQCLRNYTHTHTKNEKNI